MKISIWSKLLSSYFKQILFSWWLHQESEQTERLQMNLCLNSDMDWKLFRSLKYPYFHQAYWGFGMMSYVIHELVFLLIRKQNFLLINMTIKFSWLSIAVLEVYFQRQILYWAVKNVSSDSCIINNPLCRTWDQFVFRWV